MWWKSIALLDIANEASSYAVVESNTRQRALTLPSEASPILKSISMIELKRQNKMQSEEKKGEWAEEKKIPLLGWYTWYLYVEVGGRSYPSKACDEGRMEVISK